VVSAPLFVAPILLKAEAMTRQGLLSSALVAMMTCAPLAANAQLFGPSDEEKAREANQDAHLQQLDSQHQQLESRVQALEDKIRNLTESLAQATGNNENLSHRIDVMNDKLEREQRDFAYRLCTLSAQQLGADQATLNCGNAGATASATQQPAPAPGQGTPLPPPPATADLGSGPGRPPGIVGSLPANGAPAQLSNAAPVGPSSTAGKSDFDAAMNLLARAQYAEASAAFLAYADAHPDDPDLAPQAIYWVGDIAYVQQNYPEASRRFAELIKQYPKSNRAPDAMLKLGQSLLASGQKQEGCTALGALKAKFPDATQGTIDSAAAARKAASCPR
jgi:tol-pal system protein YbgF